MTTMGETRAAFLSLVLTEEAIFNFAVPATAQRGAK